MREGKCLRLALLHAATTNINQFKWPLCVFVYLLNSLLSATVSRKVKVLDNKRRKEMRAYPSNAAARSVILKHYQHRHRNELLRMTAGFQPSTTSAQSVFTHIEISGKPVQQSPLTNASVCVCVCICRIIKDY